MSSDPNTAITLQENPNAFGDKHTMNKNTQTKLYQQIARIVEARTNCIKASNSWADKHEDTLNELNNLLPSGSGIDNGTKIDIDESKADRIVLTFSYHHMNDVGMYDGWTDHSAIITPSLGRGFDIRITGRDRNQTKEYLYEVFYSALSEIVDFDRETKKYFLPSWREVAQRFQQSSAV